MERYEFDEEWAALEPIEKVDPAGSTSLLSGRVLLGVTASAYAQTWTLELDSLLGDWVWSMINFQQDNVQEISDIWDAYRVFSDLVDDSFASPAVQEKFVRLISYLMKDAMILRMLWSYFATLSFSDCQRLLIVVPDTRLEPGFGRSSM